MNHLRLRRVGLLLAAPTSTTVAVRRVRRPRRRAMVGRVRGSMSRVVRIWLEASAKIASRPHADVDAIRTRCVVGGRAVPSIVAF